MSQTLMDIAVEKAQYQLAIMDAAKEGAKIQFKMSGSDKWQDNNSITNLGWYFDECEYRIKVEPITRYFVRYSNGYTSESHFNTEQQARDWAVYSAAEIIKLTEVSS